MVVTAYVVRVYDAREPTRAGGERRTRGSGARGARARFLSKQCVKNESVCCDGPDKRADLLPIHIRLTLYAAENK